MHCGKFATDATKLCILYALRGEPERLKCLKADVAEIIISYINEISDFSGPARICEMAIDTRISRYTVFLQTVYKVNRDSLNRLVAV